MKFLKNLFGQKNTAGSDIRAERQADPPGEPDLIRVYDQYGQELLITKKQWRTDILPGAIKSNRDKPTELYHVIVGALNDGFRSDVIAAASQLYRIDPERVRSTCLWGIILTEENRLDEAESVFLDFGARHGDDGYVLTNLAKVYAKRNNHSKAEETLWHALAIDPNQENGLVWYQGNHHQRSGEEAGHEALRRIAALPLSWRATLAGAGCTRVKKPGTGNPLLRRELVPTRRRYSSRCADADQLTSNNTPIGRCSRSFEPCVAAVSRRARPFQYRCPSSDADTLDYRRSKHGLDASLNSAGPARRRLSRNGPVPQARRRDTFGLNGFLGGYPGHHFSGGPSASSY